MKKLYLKIQYAFHTATAYLAECRNDLAAYKAAKKKASQCLFDIRWG